MWRISSGHDLSAETLAALSKSQAIIEFNPDGTILWANENFLSLMGYGLDEVVGKHHRIFVEPVDAASPAYSGFWKDLASGTFSAAEFRRRAKGEREVWIQASYNPVIDRKGRVRKIVKVAADVTRQKLESAENNARMNAISKSQAVIEFTLDGRIITANENFCQAMGYKLEEIRGQHHSMFVEPDYARSAEYAGFWRDLAAGNFQTAEYIRYGKGGREVGISATYNPLFGLDGKPYKVVKFATVITDRKVAERLIELLRLSLERQVEGDLTGKIRDTFTGAYEELRLAYNRSLDKFAEVLGEVRSSTAAMRVATGEILAGANDLSERTTQQAAAIVETSSAMDQLAQAVVMNAQRAEQASGKAATMARTAEESSGIIRQATEAMERISTSSSKISNIIGLIDDIAFQTNLLALNASVEAARAGEAGKGFAVVAIEVRRLAQSAANASNEVKGLIDESGKHVRTGSQLVGDAADQLGAIFAGVRDNATDISDIAKANLAQQQAISEVNAAVRRMDEMTQHNAALVEQTNASIEQTEAQAVKLDSVVEIFRFESAGTQKAAPTAQRRPVAAAARTAAIPPQRKAPPRAAGNAALDTAWNEF